MRNAFDDLYGASFALREHERISSQFQNLLAIHERSMNDLIAARASNIWNDVAAQSTVNMSELVARSIDRNSCLPAAEIANTSIVAAQKAVKLSELVGGNVNGYSFLAAAEAANASISKILADTQVGFKLSELGNMISKGWMIPRESLVKGFVEVAGLTKLESHFTSISGVSSIAETVAGKIHGKQVGELLGISAKVSSSLAEGFAGFSRSYQNLFESFENEHTRILSFRPSLVRMPSVEYYNGAVLTRSVTSAELDDFDDDYVARETGEPLDYLLSRLDPDLVELLRGARQALTSSNPDRVRHFSASFRELLTHVLHMLAPDNEILGWSTSHQDFAKGRPTRRARLRYICREIDHEPFEQFVDKDIDAVLEFFQLFHEGTHKIAAQFTRRQLKALQIRVESAMRFLLEISSDED
jgi:hypothetical protein